MVFTKSLREGIRRGRIKCSTRDLARESGFSSVKDSLETAKHGRSDNVYLIRFHYLPPGGWDVPATSGEDGRKAGAATRLIRRRGGSGA